jgi:ubiquinone/menaquinone biosynthesis C-methylase UbiE
MAKQWFEKKQRELKKRLSRRFGLRSLAISQTQLSQWFSSVLGQRVLTEEQQCIDELLPEMFGYHLMQLSVLPSSRMFSASSTGHQFIVETGDDLDGDCCDEGNVKTPASSVIAHFEQLPIDADVIDVALLHHALDYSTHPHQLLREATRVLIPNGHIVLVGFNPFSLLGLGHSVARLLSRSYTYRRQHLPVSRLKDWFEVLGLELIYSRRGYYGLPFNRYYSPRMNRFLAMLLPIIGGFYVLVLRKNITPMTKIQTKWKKRSVLPAWRKGIAKHSSPYKKIAKEEK